MADYSVDQLITPLTADEIKTAIYASMAASGVTTTNWKPGAVVRTIVAAVAIVCAALSLLISYIARGGYLETATGTWLKLLAKQQYNVDFIDATFASGSVTLNNTGGGVFAANADEMIFSNTVTNKTYRNTGPVALAALQTGLSVPIRAVEAGSASSALPGEIAKLETPWIGVNVVQTAAIIGTDAEEDPALQARCGEKTGALSPNGPGDAYAYVAKTAKRLDGTSIGVTRVRTVKDGTGRVDVYCATASGAVSGTASNPATDLGAVNEAIQRAAAPLAITAGVYSAAIVSVPVSYEVWLYTSTALTEADIKAAIAAELATFFAQQPIGGNVVDTGTGFLYADAVRAVIGRARTSSGTTLGIFRTILAEPAVDLPLAITQLPVLGAVNGIVHQIPNPQGTVIQ